MADFAAALSVVMSLGSRISSILSDAIEIALGASVMPVLPLDFSLLSVNVLT